MAAITWADVTKAFPLDAGLAAVPVDSQADVLEYVNTTLSASYFGGEDHAKYKRARCYLAAHEAYACGLTSGSSAPGGAVVSESEGGVSRSYAAPSTSATKSPHDSTEYGRRFDAMVRSSPHRTGFPT